MIIDILTIVLLISGIFFFIVGVVGLLRFPDVYTRLHATTKCDTLGVGLVLLAITLNSGFPYPALKLLLIIGFIWITNPTSAHVISKAAYQNNFPLWEKSFFIDYIESKKSGCNLPQSNGDGKGVRP